MESTSAATAFAALAHDTRLAIFRGLVVAGPEGIAAGDIAAAHGLAASTLSHHIAALDHAGLVTATRRQRHIYYAVDMDKVRSLVAFMIEDCCRGAPELCGIAPARPRETANV